jgi:hypothetical protein
LVHQAVNHGATQDAHGRPARGTKITRHVGTPHAQSTPLHQDEREEGPMLVIADYVTENERKRAP